MSQPVDVLTKCSTHTEKDARTANLVLLAYHRRRSYCKPTSKQGFNGPVNRSCRTPLPSGIQYITDWLERSPILSTAVIITIIIINTILNDTTLVLRNFEPLRGVSISFIAIAACNRTTPITPPQVSASDQTKGLIQETLSGTSED